LRLAGVATEHEINDNFRPDEALCFGGNTAPAWGEETSERISP
jgi:hypothetical protein